MILRPDREDYSIIGHYLGKIIIGIGICESIPIIVAVLFREWKPAVDFLLGVSATLFIGYLLTVIFYTKRDLQTVHAMVVASLSWLAAMLVSAIPLFLSGHYGSFLDVCFETMSGYATTGLTLVRDLDHMAYAYNFWRHEMMFIGGQGIVVIALTFLFKGTSGAFSMYVGEAREEKILPNIVATARFIWLVSIVYLAIGSTALSISGMRCGLKPAKAIFDSVCLFFTAWDTGGFTPQSQSILFYHSFAFELITITLMFLGAINFALHYAVWTGNRRELLRNIETRTLALTIIGTLSITAWGVIWEGAFPDKVSFFQKAFYQLASGHTGTGYQTVYARQFVHEWGPMAMLGITFAMAIGGSICSTTGAIKVLRIGVIYKALRQDIKKLVVPESAILIQKMHHIKDIILEDKHVRNASLILLSYINLYLLGTIAGMFYGYSLSEALFESVSAAANVGLSCGITTPTMPNVLKGVYMFQMWAGRLEFISIFVMGGVLIAAIKGRR